MTLLAQIFALGAVVYLVKLVLFPFFKPTSKKQKQRIRQYARAREKDLQKKQRLEKQRVFLSKYGQFLLTDDAREEIKRTFERLDIHDTLPEELRLKQLMYALGGVLLAIITFPINALFGYASILLAVLLYLMPRDEIEKKAKLREENIARDFPAFYSMLYYQFSKSVHIHLSDIIKDYLPNANGDMAKELGVILDNIEYGEEYALKQFEQRVQIHFVTQFCDIMQTRLRGYNNINQMLYFKKEIDAFRMEMLEKELAKRQSQNTKLQMVLVVVLAVYIMAYFLFNVLSAIKLFQ